MIHFKCVNFDSSSFTLGVQILIFASNSVYNLHFLHINRSDSCRKRRHTHIWWQNKLSRGPQSWRRKIMVFTSRSVSSISYVLLRLAWAPHWSWQRSTCRENLCVCVCTCVCVVCVCECECYSQHFSHLCSRIRAICTYMYTWSVLHVLTCTLAWSVESYTLYAIHMLWEWCCLLPLWACKKATASRCSLAVLRLLL